MDFIISGIIITLLFILIIFINQENVKSVAQQIFRLEPLVRILKAISAVVVTQ